MLRQTPTAQPSLARQLKFLRGNPQGFFSPQKSDARGSGRFAYKVPTLLLPAKFSLENSGNSASLASIGYYCIASANATAMTE